MSARRLLSLSALIAVPILVAAPLQQAPSPAAPYAGQVQTQLYPGAEWDRIGRPESAGYSSQKLERVRTMLAGMPSTGMLVVVGGRVLFEYGDLDTLSYLASVRKSILAMLYGKYVASGQIRLDRTLADIGINDVGGLSEEERRATVQDLLSARSGIYHPASNSGDDTRFAPDRGTQAHGTYFLYNNWDFNALGTIFEKETGIDIYDALQRDLAEPLGFQDFRRDMQRKSGDRRASEHMAYHIYLSVRDMARVGYLMLREGRWNGQQILPEGWSRRITSPVTPLAQMNPESRRHGRFGYGYLWWVFDGEYGRGAFSGAYTGLGAVGQHITVLPELDMVLAHKTVPGGASVSHDQFMTVVDSVVAARCAPSCQ